VHTALEVVVEGFGGGGDVDVAVACFLRKPRDVFVVKDKEGHEHLGGLELGLEVGVADFEEAQLCIFGNVLGKVCGYLFHKGPLIGIHALQRIPALASQCACAVKDCAWTPFCVCGMEQRQETRTWLVGSWLR